MSFEPVVHSRLLRGITAETAFDEYTSAIGRWWPATYSPDPEGLMDVVIEPIVGGRVYLRDREIGEYVWGSVLVWDPPTSLVHSFWMAHPEDAPSQVAIDFTERPEATEVRLEHGGWNDMNVSYREKFGDWPLILDSFVRFTLDEPHG